MLKISDIFKNFSGQWIFQRVIKKLSSGEEIATMVGDAKFTSVQKSENILHYREEGTLTTEFQKNLQAYREYLYVYNQERDVIEKYFSEDEENGRLFYTLRFHKEAQNVIATGEHLCNKDFYKASYEFKSSEEFKLSYQATGPEKNYCAETVFKKKPSK